MSNIQIIMDRLTRLENENVNLKSQLRELTKKSNIKPINNKPLFSAIASRIDSVVDSINPLATSKELGFLKGRITKLESALCECKKENKTITERYRSDVKKLTDNVNNITIPKEHDHKKIELDIVKLKKLAHKDHDHKNIINKINNIDIPKEHDHKKIELDIKTLKLDSHKDHNHNKIIDIINNLIIPKEHDHKKIESNIKELKKASHNEHNHKSITDKIELIKKDIKQLTTHKKPLEPLLSEKDILKMICDKIPKQDINKITDKLVKKWIKETISLDYINRLYGK